MSIEPFSKHLRFLLIAACRTLLASTTAITAVSAYADANSARTLGSAWLIKQQRGDGSWSSSQGELAVQATATAMLALKNAGLTHSPSFGAATGWLANADADSIDSIARKVEALATAGLRAPTQAEADRLFGLRASSNSAAWGGYGGSGVDLIDTALGLGAIRQGDVGFIAKASASVNNTVLGALCSLAGARVAVAAGKQAWPTTPAATTQSAAQGRPSVLATVMVMQELRALQQATGLGGLTCNGVSVNVATMQTEAQAWLIDQQNGDGGFGEQRTDGTKGVSNLIVSALAYRALINQPVPAQPQVTNVLNWLLSQQDGVTGSWHADPLVTAQVLAVLPMAAGAELVDTDHDGLTDVVEARLGSNPSVADSRGQLGNATIAAAGINMPGFIAHATTWQPFSYNLSGGTSYSVGAGTLPPGLSLNPANGLISGTPTEPGSFSFDYDVASGIGKQTLIGRIDVSGSPLAVEDGDVPLPAWALGLLGVGLAGALRRSQKSR